MGKSNTENVVPPNNGSIIRRISNEQVPNHRIKTQTNYRNDFAFKYDEIKRMTKENQLLDNSNNNFKITDFKKSGFINLTEINYGDGIGDVKAGNNTLENDDYSFGFIIVNGYQLNEHLSLGIGIGIDKYKNTTLMPITFDARATFLKGKTSPVFIANVGYALGLDDVNGGLVINPQIGIKTYISKNVAYLFNVGYKWQARDVMTYMYYDYGFSSSATSVTYQFITISTGFAF
jgi:hypothetical protein